MTDFDKLGVAKPFQIALEAKGYSQPTPIQETAIPSILEGKDLLGLAQTGTGKTAAFAVPLLQRLLESRFRAAPKSVRSLILTPTRELADQITKNIKAYAGRTKMYTSCVVGGVPFPPQFRALQRGLDVLVATPGRLLDLHRKNGVSFDELEIFVLDEADQMLDMGFIAELEEIAYLLPEKRQTLLFSATMPREIRQLADRFLTDPVEVSTAPSATTVEAATQQIAHMEHGCKLPLLEELLAKEDCERALVFALTKKGTAALSLRLNADGFPAQAIHGDMSQAERQKTLDKFKAGKLKILVATDVAARGIDVSDISHVINYDMPNATENYVHRIGRTARAGKGGVAITFCLPEDRGMLRAIQLLIGKKIGEMDGYLFFPSDREPKSARNGAQPAGKKNAKGLRKGSQGEKPAAKSKGKPAHKSTPKPPPRRAPSKSSGSDAGSTGSAGGYLKRK
ncbi:DEAD/DEAH box helicase [Pseudovibrio sp. Tun.PSC04-5.I4]|uniref:DEAD/DEAH box helicase n=1 Tax=Pseudovibrio sp. Tun.PSC04-5.I4 TaxID=1798213 RepID=UPI000890E025|nr:DEAD/DEAH box helicase [Pseudovibrio sp. Tun.PSC04-5.I4]SDR25761.1 ATP-dependent RNA helicase RhlE [Pseudovibrio sp. Tun.PSC04-5.I4]